MGRSRRSGRRPSPGGRGVLGLGAQRAQRGPGQGARAGPRRRAHLRCHGGAVRGTPRRRGRRRLGGVGVLAFRPVCPAALGRATRARRSRPPMTIGTTEASQVVTAQRFDVCGKLPRGMTLLQASAGTGKTFTIAALTTRYVAEGLPIDRLLVITFTRMATGELRERVRDRLVRAFDGLVDVLDGAGGHEDDEIVQLLA